MALDETEESLGSHAPARNLSGEITEDGVGSPHVVPDDLMESLVRLSRLIQFEDRDPESFLVHVPRAGADPVAADVGVMDGRSEVGDHPAAMEDGGENRDVEEMARGEPGVVDDEDVSRLELLRGIAGDDLAARLRESVDMAGSAGYGLGHHPPLGIEDRRREVACLAHDGTEGDALERARLLAHDADEVAPENLELDRVHIS